MSEEVTLIRIEGIYRRQYLTSMQAFRDIDEYFVWKYQKDGQETVTEEGVTTMLYMNRRAKIKLIKKISPEYQVENLQFSDYTAQELSEI